MDYKARIVLADLYLEVALNYRDRADNAASTGSAQVYATLAVAASTQAQALTTLASLGFAMELAEKSQVQMKELLDDNK